jgi:hypothetical protein
MESEDASQLDLLSPGLDFSLVNPPCDSGIFNLTVEDLNMTMNINMPFTSDLPSYLFENAPNHQHTNHTFTEPYQLPPHDAPISVSDWVAFDTPPTPELPFPLLSPQTPGSELEIDSCDPSLLMNTGSVPQTPSISENPSDASTLVLEDLRPETVNLVIDTLLRTNSKFGMRLYNTGS